MKSSRCNQHRYNFVVGRDLETNAILPLFNPRKYLWLEHFTWSADATKIIGTTAIGRATCDRLGRLGGKSRSGAKAQASRDNGKHGGRPRKPLTSESFEDE